MITLGTKHFEAQIYWAFEDGGSRWVTIATGPDKFELATILDVERTKRTWGNYCFGTRIWSLNGVDFDTFHKI